MNSIATRLQSCNQSVHDEFRTRLERRPYACDLPGPGMSRMAREDALRQRYIALNSSQYLGCMSFDIDVPGVEAVLVDTLGPPSFLVWNPPGHPHEWRCHAHYLLRDPVKGDHLKLRAFFGDVRKRIGEYVGADTSFNNLLLKNPVNDYWIVRSHPTYVTLAELSESVPSSPRATRRLNPVDAGRNEVGNRNRYLFDSLRQYAYRERLRYADPNDLGKIADEAALRASITQRARMIAAECATPLTDREVLATTKSVLGYVLTVYVPGSAAPGPMGFEPMPAVMDAGERAAERARRQREGAEYVASVKRNLQQQRIMAAQARIAGQGKKPTMAATARELGCNADVLRKHYGHLFGRK